MNKVVTKNKKYTDIFEIKDIYLNEIAPKYFNLEDINQLNVGLFGQINETMASTTEDIYSTISAYSDELIPVKARLPESIYGYATTVQIYDLFAKPANLKIKLLVRKDYIIRPTNRKRDFYEIHIDKNTIVNIEDNFFTFEYDIRIQAIPFRDYFVYNTVFVLDHDNMISDVKNPYLKSYEIEDHGDKYLSILVNVKQMQRHYEEFNIVNNTVINMPVITVSFENRKLCGFNIFYSKSVGEEKVQLIPRLLNTSPLKEPFCYYRLKNDETFELSFTTKDYYFKPDINSMMYIEYFTTEGKDGNFAQYKGDKIAVICKSERFDYNNQFLLHADVVSGSEFGLDMPTLDDIKASYLEKMTTIDSYTTDMDLQIHFDNFSRKNNMHMKLVKTRDDFQRIYTAFVLMKDRYGDLYHTNTLSTVVTQNMLELNTHYTNNNVLVIKPGRIFTYNPSDPNYANLHPTKKVTDDYSDLNEKFIYSNPFLINIIKRPNSVAYYLNSVDKFISTDYSYINDKSSLQFICNGFHIRRYALNGEDDYVIEIETMPTSKIPDEIWNKLDGPSGLLKAIFTIYDDRKLPVCYKEFKITNMNKEDSKITMSLTIKTNDVMNLRREFRVLDMNSLITNQEEECFIPILNCICKISMMYDFKDEPSKNIGVEPYNRFTLTNEYTTVDTLVDWIYPLNIMHSDFKFLVLENSNWGMDIHSIPLVAADELKDGKKKVELLENIDKYIRYVDKAVSKITNNYSVDLKFFNSYGKSKVMTIGDRDTLLDRVNLKLHLQIRPKDDTPIKNFLNDVTRYIKDYIEKVNVGIFNNFHISNLTKSLETTFPDIIYIHFLGINEYDSTKQSLFSKYAELETLYFVEKRHFVPEFLNINLEDVDIKLISDNINSI